MNKKHLIFAEGGIFHLLLALILFILPVSCRTTDNREGSGIEKSSHRESEKETREEAPLAEEPDKETLASRLESFRSVKDASEALKTLEDAEELGLEERILKAALMLSRGKREEARRELDALEKEAPDNPGVLYNKALLEHVEGNINARDALLNRTLKLDPFYEDALFLKGSLDFAAKRYAKANSSFQAILKKEPENFMALAGAGAALMNMEKLETAVKLLDKAIALEPDYAYLYVDRARAWKGLKKYGKAEEDYGRAIALEPGVEWHYLDRARIRIRYFHDLEGAWEDLESLEKINGNNFFAHVFKAGILDEWKRYDEAEQYYDKILEERPQYGFAHEPLAKIAYMHRDYKKGKKHFLKAYEFQPNDVLYVLAATICMEKLGNRNEAVSLLKQAARKVKQDSLEYEMIRYYLEPGSSYFVTSKIVKEKNEDLQSRMYFYLGARDDLKGLGKSALASYENVKNTNFYEAELADWEINHP